MSGSNNDPFAFQGDPNAPGALGQSVGFWQDLARYGGNVAAAANARTASGHLANGTGALGAFGAAINPTLDAARQNAVTRSNLGLQRQQTQHAGMENQLLSYQLPIAQANAELNAKLMDPVFARNYMQSLYGDQNAPPAGGVAPQGGPGPSGLINSESGGNPGAVNKATGASGLAQFTPGRLADLGMYQPPAQGGQWTGQFNIPGFPGVKTYQDFLSNPQAQQAAYTAHMADVQKNIAATPGANKFDPNGLAAVAHLGGVHGMQKFVATNGGYNPSDANGTSLMAYYQKFSGHGAASPASGPRTASAPMAGGGAPQSAALPAPVQVAGPGAPTDATIAPPAPVGVNPNAPVQMPPPPAAPTPGQPQAPPQQQAQGPGPMVPGGRGEQPQAPQQPQGAFTAPSQQPATVQPDQALMGQALDYERRAGILEQQQNFARDRQKMGVIMPMPPGDPAILRAAAAEFRKGALAGPIAALQEGAKLPFVAPTEEAKAGVALRYAGPTEAAKAANSNVDLRPGGMARVQTPNGPEWIKNPQLERVQGPSGAITYAHVAPALPGSPPGSPGTMEPVLDASGNPVVEKISPTASSFMHERGKDLADQFHKIDADAASAVQSNYLFDNLRSDSKSWQMGKFADVEGSARAWLSAAAHAVGVTPTGLDKQLSDYESFKKTSGSLLRTAVHDTSSRAAVQEYNLIALTLPHPTSSERGFGQIADQWQGINDYQQAKQVFANAYRGKPEDFNVAFNSQVSPGAFMLNRMSQTPGGAEDMKAMVAEAQKTPQGRMTLNRMMTGYTNAQKLGLFDNLVPIGGAPAQEAP